ncbi:unnamed protein product [Didymodactylos carnosus]|uniref:Glycosyltransferase family 92 protein n=1 Tax=Didymodactylos carnosus TaxID=1234261 RepID=A0A8S2RDZ8_9BILA|nr:unnamed protein product [Didymodactylos carnosus]CAF4158751.1 unnamed protein product [Didymodactylos carnosus]
MIFPTDIPQVIKENKHMKQRFDNLSENYPSSSHKLDLWCIFEDGSRSQGYSYDSLYYSERVSLLDCPLTEYGRKKLQTKTFIQVLLSSFVISHIPILKGSVNISLSSVLSKSSNWSFTLCTSPLQDKYEYLPQWIEFHRLVGVTKIVVYNTTDTHNRLEGIASVYRQHVGFLEIVQWNFSSLQLKDIDSSRYFQVEAVHDCLLRFGDQSEWLGMIDLDEYLISLSPYTTISDFLRKEYGRQIIGSINLWSNFFCTRQIENYTQEESVKSLLVIERFTLRSSIRYTDGREKYLYRPRFVQYLSIHHQIVGVSKQDPSEKKIMLAHYGSMEQLRLFPGCEPNKYVIDTTIRDRFAANVKEGLKHPQHI